MKKRLVLAFSYQTFSKILKLKKGLTFDSFEARCQQCKAYSGVSVSSKQIEYISDFVSVIKRACKLDYLGEIETILS